MYAERPIIPKIKPPETTLVAAPLGLELAEAAGRATVDEDPPVDRALV